MEENTDNKKELPKNLQKNLITLAHFLIINSTHANTAHWKAIKNDWEGWYRMWKEKESADVETN